MSKGTLKSRPTGTMDDDEFDFGYNPYGEDIVDNAPEMTLMGLNIDEETFH